MKNDLTETTIDGTDTMVVAGEKLVVIISTGRMAMMEIHAKIVKMEISIVGQITVGFLTTAVQATPAGNRNGALTGEADGNGPMEKLKMKNDLTLTRTRGTPGMDVVGMRPMASTSTGKMVVRPKSAGTTEMATSIVGKAADGFLTTLVNKSRI